jgi:hypothetical protein
VRDDVERQNEGAGTREEAGEREDTRSPILVGPCLRCANTRLKFSGQFATLCCAGVPPAAIRYLAGHNDVLAGALAGKHELVEQV